MTTCKVKASPHSALQCPAAAVLTVDKLQAAGGGELPLAESITKNKHL